MVMKPSEEEQLVLDNIDFIRMCAWDYIRETNLSPSWFDDVAQEAAIAYVELYRRINSGKLSPRYAKASIRYRLMGKFVDRNGMGINFSNIKRAGAPVVLPRPDVRGTICDDTDFDSVYLRDWIASLPPEDAEIVSTKIRTGKPPEKWRKRNGGYRYHLRMIRRSYDDYFNEAG